LPFAHAGVTSFTLTSFAFFFGGPSKILLVVLGHFISRPRQTSSHILGWKSLHGYTRKIKKAHALQNVFFFARPHENLISSVMCELRLDFGTANAEEGKTQTSNWNALV
jgi:hypothetical protein